MRHVLPVFLIVPLLTLAQPPPGYYDPAYGLNGEALREALFGIINGHNVVPNSDIWIAFAATDNKPDGTVWDMYSDAPTGTPPYVYEFVMDQCGTYNSEGDCFNREHSFPQSWYNNSAPMSTDLFHVYPADAWVNQQRGNLAYGTVSNPNWTSMNGGKRGPCSWPDCSGTVFEPINAYKGDFARSFFYMLTRYLSQLNSWDSPMMEDGGFTPWAGSLLIAWHLEDPVSQKEIDRNNAVFGLQGNRNPYIDEPQWVQYVWGPTASVADHYGSVVRMWHSDATLYIRQEQFSSTAALRIFDATGRLVFDRPLNEASIDLPLELMPGSYVATYGSERSVQVIRFVQ